MPYPVLDAIERAAIRDKQCPVEVFRIDARPSFPTTLWTICTSGSPASSASGAATNGSGNAIAVVPR